MNFWLLCDQQDWISCWLWKGSIDKKGYGRFGNERAHRISYKRAYGPLPKDKEIHHICRTKNCINPRHLVVLSSLNHPDSVAFLNSRKTHCKRGHEFTRENIYRNTKGNRVCQTCIKMYGKNKTRKNN